MPSGTRSLRKFCVSDHPAINLFPKWCISLQNIIGHNKSRIRPQDPQPYVILNISNALLWGLDGKGTSSAAGFQIQPCLDNFAISLWPFVDLLNGIIMALSSHHHVFLDK